MFANTSLGFCMWDIPALIVLIVVITVFIFHRHHKKKQDKNYDDQIAQKLAQSAVQGADDSKRF